MSYTAITFICFSFFQLLPQYELKIVRGVPFQFLSVVTVTPTSAFRKRCMFQFLSVVTHYTRIMIDPKTVLVSFSCYIWHLRKNIIRYCFSFFQLLLSHGIWKRAKGDREFQFLSVVTCRGCKPGGSCCSFSFFQLLLLTTSDERNSTVGFSFFQLLLYVLKLMLVSLGRFSFFQLLHG